MKCFFFHHCLLSYVFCIQFFRPQFYLTFWSLSMSDLQVPEDAYSQRVTALEHEMKQIDERKELVCYNKSMN